MRNISFITEPALAWGCVPTALVRIGVLAALCWFLTACERAPFYEQTAPIEDGRWAYADTVRFPFTITDTSLRYNMYLEVAHADTFPYQNVYVQFHTTYPDGQCRSQVLSLDLFDATGQPNGPCRSGICRSEFVLQENAIFPQPGQYLLAVEQYMRFSPVVGVEGFRLRIESAAPATAAR